MVCALRTHRSSLNRKEGALLLEPRHRLRRRHRRKACPQPRLHRRLRRPSPQLQLSRYHITSLHRRHHNLKLQLNLLQANRLRNNLYHRNRQQFRRNRRQRRNCALGPMPPSSAQQMPTQTLSDNKNRPFWVGFLSLSIG